MILLDYSTAVYVFTFETCVCVSILVCVWKKNLIQSHSSFAQRWWFLDRWNQRFVVAWLEFDIEIDLCSYLWHFVRPSETCLKLCYIHSGIEFDLDLTTFWFHIVHRIQLKIYNRLAAIQGNCLFDLCLSVYLKVLENVATIFIS